MRYRIAMFLKVEVDGRVTTLQLDRPRKAHAYHPALLDELEAAIDAVSTPVVVVSSTGDGAFCGGADLDAMKSVEPLAALDLRSQRVFDKLARSPAVSIAAVQGAAIAGGCELALACDVRIVGPRARFALPETALGIIPSAGGCARLPKLIGAARAKQMILLGYSVDGKRAVDWGLAAELADEPLTRAQTIGAAAADRDPVALRLAKQVIDGVDGLGAERIAEALLYLRKRG